MSPHTPGPWTAYSHAPYSVWCGDASGMGATQIAACRVVDEDGLILPYMEKDGEVAKANARLIAAAPELLESLKWAMQGLSYSTRIKGQNESWCDGIDAARAAIAKAEGKKS